MNERLNISDLVVLIAEYTGKDKKFIELFLKELIAVISDSLLEERLVKVKGLGTFKVIQVEERESVHVNTGERFIIPSHSKFTFTPDKELREQVNKPFASFETTELNEGVAFPENTDDNQDVQDDSDEIEEEKEIIPDKESKTELTDGSRTTQELEELSNSENESRKIDSEEKEELSTEVQQQESVIPTPVARAKRNWLVPGLGLLAIICLVAGGFYYFTVYSGEKGNSKIVSSTKEQAVISKPEPVVTNEEPETEIESEAAIEPEAKIKQPETTNNADTDVAAVDVKTVQKDPIVVKIEPDSRLTLIALEHYGHKVFWVYIYEHNKAIIKNPNNIQIGTALVIPDASLYGIDAKNPESIQKAKAMQAEINSKF